MLISIITVVYNAVNTIEATIKSVLRQRYESIEFVIVDGGSTDGTLDIIKKYDDKIRWVSEPDNGIYNALNKSIKMANGERVLFLGADDTLENVIHEVVPSFKEASTIYYGNAYMLQSKIIYAGRFNAFKIAHQNICHQAIFYPRSVFNDYLYNEKNKVHADYELNLRLYSDNRFRFEFIDKVISNYSEQGFSTKAIDKFYPHERFNIVKKHFPYYIYVYARWRYILTRLIKGKHE